jgi:hypothetical protein
LSGCSPIRIAEADAAAWASCVCPTKTANATAKKIGSTQKPRYKFTTDIEYIVFTK